MSLETEHIGTLEDVVKDPRLMDRAIKHLSRLFNNSPSFNPERRRFLQYTAVLAGLIAAERLPTADAATWETHLLRQDIIRGPPLLIHPETGKPSDFEHHKLRPINQGWGAVDYVVPIGIPIIPTADAYGKINILGGVGDGNIGLSLAHSSGFRSVYFHLSKYAEIINELPDFSKLDQETIRKLLQDKPKLGKLVVVAYSGNTGRGPGPGGYQPPHLDFRIRKREKGKLVPPGVDPFKVGIDQNKPVGGKDEYGLPLGGRPVYWDGQTEIDFSPRRTQLLQESSDTLDARLKESNLDNATVQEILRRQNNPIDLRDYLGRRVLEKKVGPDGKPRYEFMPGSLMYALMLEFYSRASSHEFIAMLPFIFPPLKEVYQQANPKVKF